MTQPECDGCERPLEPMGYVELEDPDGRVMALCFPCTRIAAAAPQASEELRGVLLKLLESEPS